MLDDLLEEGPILNVSILGGLIIAGVVFRIGAIHADAYHLYWSGEYGVKDEVGCDIGTLMFRNDAFLKPSYGLPAFELDGDLIGDDVFEEVEVDLSLDSVSCKVERTVDLDERCCH